ncbi:MAG: hypothetical protein M3N02_03950, partial [Pseudomonadota bacterium]|nr:hypothetical protein [Pseudomonadota bacterium]
NGLTSNSLSVSIKLVAEFCDFRVMPSQVERQDIGFVNRRSQISLLQPALPSLRPSFLRKESRQVDVTEPPWGWTVCAGAD